jgi:hypothetical protein
MMNTSLKSYFLLMFVLYHSFCNKTIAQIARTLLNIPGLVFPLRGGYTVSRKVVGCAAPSAS